MNRKKLRHDRHTVSDHMGFAPNTGERCLFGDVAMICQGIICETCMEIISGRLAVSLGLGGRDVVETFIREQDRCEYNREK